MSKIILFLLIFCVGCASNPRFKAEKDTQKPNSKTQTNKMQTEIERLLGTPYSKIDCSGFVAEVYQNSMNYKLPHNSQKMFKIGKKISEKSLRFGDLVFFKGRFGKEISHVGIYIGSSKFAHSSTSEGVTYNYLHEDYYKKRYVGAKRVLKN